MTVSILFEIRDTDPDSALSKMLREVDDLGEYSIERERIIAQVEMWDAIRRLEKCAASEALDRREKSIVARARATREAKKAAPSD